jgi:hypothetical protein
MKAIDTILPKFSFFDGPITNKWPNASATIVDIYRGITSDYYKYKTEQVRNSKNQDQYRKAKMKLDFVTFAGTFQSRDKKNLTEPSGYCCIDFDHIEQDYIEGIKTILLNDPVITTALLFRSPSFSGLKWIVEVDLVSYPDYEDNFRGIVAYLRNTYPDYFNLGNSIIDETGKDVCRACFLCHDPEAYLNQKYQPNGKVI